MSELLAPAAAPEASVFTEQPQRQVQFLTTGVTPPSDLYIGPDDSIRVEVFSQNAGILVHVKLRFVRANGDMMYEEEQLSTAALPASASQDYRLGEGFLLSVALTSDLTVNSRGRVFATVSYIRAFGSSQSSFMHTLVQGYVAGLQRVSWPVIQTDWGVNGQGLIIFRNLPSPPVGQAVTWDTLNQVRTRVMSFTAGVTASAAVANRYGYLLAQVAGVNYVQQTSTTPQTAGQVVFYSITPGIPTQLAAPSYQLISWPLDLYLPGGTALQFGLLNIAAGDQIAGVALSTEEWIDM
jgi:hypothetical protein